MGDVLFLLAQLDGHTMNREPIVQYLVVGSVRYRISTSVPDSAMTMTLKLKRDDLPEWNYTVPSWCGVGIGAGSDGYMWIARQLFILPRQDIDVPTVISFDEDLLAIFQLDDQWLAVCETSLRLVSREVESSRVEADEVIEDAWWENSYLVVRDVRGVVWAATIEGDQITWMQARGGTFMG